MCRKNHKSAGKDCTSLKNEGCMALRVPCMKLLQGAPSAVCLRVQGDYDGLAKTNWCRQGYAPSPGRSTGDNAASKE